MHFRLVGNQTVEPLSVGQPIVIKKADIFRQQRYGLRRRVRTRFGLFFLLPESGGYLPSGLWGAPGKGSPRPAEDNRLCPCLQSMPQVLHCSVESA